MKFKKLLIACLSVATIFTAATACKDKKNPDSSNDSTSSSSQTGHVHSWSAWSSTDATCTEPALNKRTCACGDMETQVLSPALGHVGVWTVLKAATCTESGEKQTDCTRCKQKAVKQSIDPIGHQGKWTVLTQPTCTTAGAKERICSVCSTKESAEMPARGHVYENGFCSVCSDGPAFPADAGDTALLQPLSGTGTETERLECVEGYYQFTIPSSKALWLSFSISQPGQYALYSVGETNGCTLTQHDASPQFIPKPGTPCVTLQDGTIYSSVSCSETFFNEHWRATFCLSGIKNATVKLRFARIADPAWEPATQEELVFAKEINGVKAEDPPTGFSAKEVPLTSTYFYDESCGYYRMGTAENPGAIIYAAITREASRLYGNGSFITTLDTSNPFNLSLGKMEDGNEYVKNYAFMITNYQYEIKDGRAEFLTDDDSNKIPDYNVTCYQNYVNSDGMYPVTKELYDFLVLYTKNHPPVIWENGMEGEQWLTACYYYSEIPLGTSGNPQPLEIGTNTLSLTGNNYYCTIKVAGSYTITCETEGVVMQILDVNYGEGTGAIQTTVTITQETTVLLWSESGDLNDVVITLTQA